MALSLVKSLIPREFQEPEPLAPIMMPDAPMPQLPATPPPQVVLRDQDAAGSMAKLLAPQTPQVELNQNPVAQQVGHAQNQLQRFEMKDQPYEWGKHGVGGKIAHVLNVAGNIAGDIFAPSVMARIPGTQLNRQAQEEGLKDEISGGQKQLSEEALQGAQINTAQNQATASELTPASQQEADAYGVPLGTPMNAATRAALAKQSGINQTKLTTTHETNQTRTDIAAQNAKLKQEVAALKPEQRDDRAIRLMSKQDQGQPLTQEEDAYLKSYGKWVDQTKTQPGIARAAAYAQFRPVQVLGENGDVHYDSAASAIKSGAATPSSMNFRTATGMAKFMTSGKGGQTITAYNTANDHLDLLGKAMDALDNGDVQGLNQLSNRFKQEFGSPAPTNVNAVKAMLAGELANVAKVTGATDPEIKEQKDNINRAASPEQIRGFIETNHDLMDQKAYEMYQQYQQGMLGKPAFNTGLTGRNPTNQAGAGAPPPGAKIIKWEDVK